MPATTPTGRLGGRHADAAAGKTCSAAHHDELGLVSQVRCAFQAERSLGGGCDASFVACPDAAYLRNARAAPARDDFLFNERRHSMSGIRSHRVSWRVAGRRGAIKSAGLCKISALRGTMVRGVRCKILFWRRKNVRLAIFRGRAPVRDCPRRGTIGRRPRQAKVAELVDALDLGSSGVTRESSSLSFRTTFE